MTPYKLHVLKTRLGWLGSPHKTEEGDIEYINKSQLIKIIEGMVKKDGSVVQHPGIFDEEYESYNRALTDLLEALDKQE